MKWLLELLSPIITKIGSWFSQWSTQKAQAKHEERMRQYDLMEKALEGSDELSKKTYQKWFYEQEISKKTLKRQCKKLKDVKAVPDSYKEVLKEENFFELLNSLENQNVVEKTLPEKEIQVNGNN